MTRHRGPPAARRRARLWALGASLLAAIGLTTWVLPTVEAWQRRRDARTSLGALLGCMYGAARAGEPGEPDDDSRRRQALRQRAIAVTAAGGAHRDWPARCAPHLLALEVALRALQQLVAPPCDGSRCCPDDAHCQRFGEARAMSAALRHDLAGGQLGRVAPDGVADAVAACGIDAVPVLVGPAPPPPAMLIERAAVEPVARGIRQLATDPACGDSLALLLYGGRGSARACRLDLADAATARCRDVGHRVLGDESPQMLGREAGAPVQLLVRRARAVLELVDGETGTVTAQLEGAPIGGYGWADGTTVVVTRRDEPGALTIWRGGGRARPVAEQFPLPAQLLLGPTVAVTELVWLAAAADGAAELWAHPLSPTGPLLGASARIGGVGAVDGARAIESCRSGAVTAVVLAGPPEGQQSPVTLAFAEQGRWSAIRRERLATPRFGVACADGAVSLGWTDTLWEAPRSKGGAPAVAGRYLVGRARCSPSGCVEERAELELERHSASSRWIFADAGSRVSVVWRSPLGDVRHRTAPIAELESAGDQPLFDDEAHGGFGWELGASDTVVRAGEVLLLARTSPEHGDLAALIALGRAGRPYAVPVE